MGFVVSCSTIYGVQYNYNEQVDSESLKAYEWMNVPKKANITSIDVDRVKKAVNAQLQAKGFMVASRNPDFLIAEQLGKKGKMQVQHWGYGYYATGYERFESPDDVFNIEYKEGSLILDFVDAKSKKLIWRGVAKTVVHDADTPEKKEKSINEAVKELLKNFPPKT